ncbi:MAG: ParB/RepB/Spo0J family partition protein [Turneriella sp.]|nr:ParB/RepB/Spo0J family partition protein [Turneriella sp.]
MSRDGRVLGRGLANLLEGADASGTRIEEIPIERIRPNPENPRKKFDQTAIAELAQTIKEHGLLQPILVQKQGEHYVVISGERRLRALLSLGAATAPCVVREIAPQQSLEIALIENIQREELDPIEEANVYKKLLNEYGLTQEQLAERVGKNRVTITNRLRLLQLPELVQAALADGRISEGQARPLLSLKSREQQLLLFSEITAKQLSARAVEERVRTLLSGRSEGNKKSKSKKSDANLRALQARIEEHIGMRTHLRYNTKTQKGSITFDFFSLEDLEKLLRTLGLRRVNL